MKIAPFLLNPEQQKWKKKKKRVSYGYFQSLVYNESNWMLESLWIEGFWNLAKKKEKKKDHFQTTKERGVNYFQNRKQQSINGVEPLNKEGKILYMWLAQLLTTEHKLSIL